LLKGGLLIILTEEFNHYLSYVRNLGFEDTPDYDHLRDLFTQAARNAQEPEDGEYDWMKLNGGRGWESKSSATGGHHHGINAAPDASNRALVGVRGLDGRPSKTDARAAISADRLNAAQPPPPGSPAKPGQAALGKTSRDRGNVSGVGANLPKRSSGLAAQLNANNNTPSASMQAQMQTSNLDLVSPSTARPSPATGALQSNSQGRNINNNSGQAQEGPPTFLQKLMKVFCCGGSR
jgi:casein kinase 1